MSFGDPNNPYGQQPQGQPGYGYPQQAPQGIPPQGGYAYPQQQAPQGYPAYPAGPGGYPGMPAQMPGLVKTARVLLFIIGGLEIVIALFAAIGGAVLASTSSTSSTSSGLVGGVLVAVAIVVVGFGILAIVLAAKFGKGGNGVRITTIVFASLSLLGSLSNFANTGGTTPAGVLGGIIGLAIGGIILAAMVSSSGAAWFKRPRY